MTDTKSLHHPYIFDANTAAVDLESALIHRLSLTSSVATLGVGALMEIHKLDQNVVNHFLQLEELVLQCQEIAEHFVMKLHEV